MFTLVYRVHRILVAASKGKLVIPYGVDREAVHRFVDEVFFATQFLGEDTHSEAKARQVAPMPRRRRVPRVLRSLPRLRTAEMTRVGQIRALAANRHRPEACKPAGLPARWSSFTRPARLKASKMPLRAWFANSGASFIVHVGPNVPEPEAPNGFMVPEAGKPYMPTAAQRVKIPRGLSRI